LDQCLEALQRNMNTPIRYCPSDVEDDVFEYSNPCDIFCHMSDSYSVLVHLKPEFLQLIGEEDTASSDEEPKLTRYAAGKKLHEYIEEHGLLKDDELHPDQALRELLSDEIDECCSWWDIENLFFRLGAKRYGIAAPSMIKKELLNFLHEPEGTELSRTDVVKRVYMYMRDNKLMDGKIVRLDQPLQKLLGVTVDPTFFALPKLLAPFFIKK
jgi:hypothetical protein